VYNKTDVLGLQTFLRDKFAVWARNGSCVEEIWNNFKNIVHECIEHFVPRNILRKNSDPEYYNKEIKRLKPKVRKAYNRRNVGVHYLEELKQLSKQLLAAKKSAQEAFLTCTARASYRLGRHLNISALPLARASQTLGQPQPQPFKYFALNIFREVSLILSTTLKVFPASCSD
jgi:hypothetical protein